MDKYEVAQILREMAFFIELTDKNPKKSIAYRKAANSIENCDEFDVLLKKNNLEIIPGIGKKISQMITNLTNEHHLPYHTHLKNSIPSTLQELINIPGLNIKKIKILFENFNIKTVEELNVALEEKKIIGVQGFTPYFLEKLKQKVLRYCNEGNYLLYPKASHIAEILKEKLIPFTTKIEITGSLRRKCEIINEINFLVTTNNSDSCCAKLINYGYTQQVIEKKPFFLKVLLKQGIHCTLQIVEKKDFPLAFLKSTGNKKHLEELNSETKNKNFYLESISYSKESDIYKSLNLNFILPELREGYGEVKAAKTYDFSDLIEENDLKGVFHCHTVDSDGENTIEEMANAAKKMGWQYIGITDHSKSSYQARGLSEERLLSQIELIKQYNKIQNSDFKVFSGIECDILKDGELDFCDDILKKLDFVIVSIHSLFKQEKEIMTNRIIKAIEHPYTTMIGHLSGRLLRSRDPYKLDITKIIDACIANDKIIEINSHPSRLDMDWRYWIQAKDRGLKCSINPDAHSIYELNNCHYGVNIARKGWLKKEDVINTLSLEEMIIFLKKRKP